MGWARRRRQQQQQLRRRASKEYLSAILKAEETYYNNLSLHAALAPVDTDLQFTKNPAIEDNHHEVAKASASKWYDNASPRKIHSHSLGGHKQSGLREKLYSVDSLAETEPEDDDEDDDTESEEDSDSGESVFSSRHLVHEAIAAPLLPAVLVKIEASIQEEEESVIPPAAASSKKLDTSDDEEEEDSDDTDLEEDGYASEGKPSVAMMVMMSASEDEDEAKCETSKLIEVVVDGEDTESEDGDIEEVASTASFVSAVSSSSASSSISSEEFTKVDLFGQSLNKKKAKEESQHAPFLFPPPYFPGDLDEYESDIYETLLRREKVHHVVTDYFSFQPHVTGVMRAMLIDWLVEVHNHFNLQSDTLYLTVNYIDRFLAKVPVKRENFQLVALTALLIASKFEEVHPVDIEDLVYICERSYTAQQIVQFEKEMLQAFKFNLVVPTCSGFLEYYVDKLSVDLQVSQLANFFSEQTLLDFHLSAKYVPSVIASSSLLLAQCYFDKSKPELSWVLEFEEVTGYYAKDIWCCVRDLSDMLASLSFDLVAVRTKYRSSRLGRVADIPHLNVSNIVIE